MWILPKNLPPLSGAPDTAGFISDLNEQSQACASSLMVRSKPSPARTWSQKWKRDSWTQHLSGRILKHSHARSFATGWACLWPVIPASHSVRPESGSEPKTLGTSGHTLPEQFELFDLDSVSSRMSKDTLAWDCAKSSETWEQQVTRRRGEYSARVKSARLTSGSGSSSWPTIRASEYKDVGPVGSKSHDHMLGKHYLCAVVTQEAANWLTPATVQIQRTDMQKRIDYRASIGRKYVPGSLEGQMQQHGQAAPANHSTHGSRQGLSHKKGDLWSTHRTGATESSRPNNKGGIPLADQAKREQWGTPTDRDHKSGRGNEEREYKELTPMVERTQAGKLNPRWVETLMGLPVGWVMPSCVSPVTIAQTSCDSSATESCLPQQSELF